MRYVYIYYLMMSNVLMKIEVNMPYGGGYNGDVIGVAISKYILGNKMFTLNSSHHGNKTAREQFKLVGYKYRNMVILNGMMGVSHWLYYQRNVVGLQGIDSTNVSTCFSYDVNYSVCI